VALVDALRERAGKPERDVTGRKGQLLVFF
jgi:hypothetical protein